MSISNLLDLSFIDSLVFGLPPKDIYWFSISGTWKKHADKIESDVRTVVNALGDRGYGIVSGGALGVDFYATDQILKRKSSNIKVFIPTTLDLYLEHHAQWVQDGLATQEQINLLADQLQTIYKMGCLIENAQNKILNDEQYYIRNTDIVEASDALIAFHINESEGTQDAINKALQMGKPVKEFRYTF